jgi:hypothetical protein
LVPTGTFPKLRLAGVAVSAPGVVAVPVSAAEMLALAVSEVTSIEPAAAPVDAGLNVTVKTVLCPAESVMGRAGPLMLKPLPEVVAAETVALDPPVFVSVTFWV